MLIWENKITRQKAAIEIDTKSYIIFLSHLQLTLIKYLINTGLVSKPISFNALKITSIPSKDNILRYNKHIMENLVILLELCEVTPETQQNILDFIKQLSIIPLHYAFERPNNTYIKEQFIYKDINASINSSYILHKIEKTKFDGIKDVSYENSNKITNLDLPRFFETFVFYSMFYQDYIDFYSMHLELKANEKFKLASFLYDIESKEKANLFKLFPTQPLGSDWSFEIKKKIVILCLNIIFDNSSIVSKYNKLS